MSKYDPLDDYRPTEYDTPELVPEPEPFPLLSNAPLTWEVKPIDLVDFNLDSDELERPSLLDTVFTCVDAVFGSFDSAAKCSKLASEQRIVEAQNRLDKARIQGRIDRATMELEARNNLLDLADSAAIRERILQIKQAGLFPENDAADIIVMLAIIN